MHPPTDAFIPEVPVICAEAYKLKLVVEDQIAVALIVNAG